MTATSTTTITNGRRSSAASNKKTTRVRELHCTVVAMQHVQDI